MFTTIKAKLFISSMVSILLFVAVIFAAYYISLNEVRNIMIQDIKTTANALEKSILYIAKKDKDAYKDTEFRQTIYDTKIGKTGYVYMINQEGTMVVHHKKEGKNYAGKDYIDYIRSRKEGGIYEYTSATTGQHKIAAFRYIPQWKLWVIPGINKAEYYNKIEDRFFKYFGIIMIFLIVFLMGVGYSIYKTTVVSLEGLEKGLNDFFDFISYKTTNSKKLEVHYNDEIGKMAKAINTNIERTREGFIQDSKVLEEVNDITKSIQQGVFTNKVSSTSNNPALNQLKDDLNIMIDSMQSKIGDNMNNLVSILNIYMNSDFSKRVESPKGNLEVIINKLGDDISSMLNKSSSNAQFLNSKSDSLNNSVLEVTELSKEQNSHLDEILSYIEELKNIISSNNEKSQGMQKLTTEVKELSNSGTQLSQDTSTSMDEINHATSMINESVGAIESIAFQTNILSLNAAVEAATAGEAGKGFAVVAGEVRNLASKSAEAAQNIRTSVDEAQNKSILGQEISSKMIKQYDILISKIDNTIVSIDSVNSARHLQAEKIGQIADSIDALKTVSDKNLDISNSTKNITDELRNISEEILKDISDKKF
jgi:methyl-accepting chemotaxis protein